MAPDFCRLEGAGWNDHTRKALERLIRRGSGKHLPVVLDFDNTIVCGDIGEATLAVLAGRGILTPAKVPPLLCPPFRVPGGRWVRMAACAAVTEYYEALLASAAHAERDPAPMANGYAWAVEVMAGLRPAQIVEATRAACEGPALIEVTPGTTGYAAPFFYPEMVELIAELARHRFEVWIVSASNVWSVRWMVLEALNPLLRQRGLRHGLRSDHVIGISCLLQDAAGGLYKDGVLAREHEGYAALDERVLGRFHLTSRLQFPVPTYSGKVAAIFDALGRNPFLAAGDSPGDHPMLAVSENRLWIARLEKPGYLRATRELMRQSGSARWMFQAARTKQAPGFVPREVLPSRPPRCKMPR
jgi:phosphoserine phosphatase